MRGSPVARVPRPPSRLSHPLATASLVSRPCSGPIPFLGTLCHLHARALLLAPWSSRVLAALGPVLGPAPLAGWAYLPVRVGPASSTLEAGPHSPGSGAAARSGARVASPNPDTLLGTGLWPSRAPGHPSALLLWGLTGWGILLAPTSQSLGPRHVADPDLVETARIF